MSKIYLATQNQGKLKEFFELLSSHSSNVNPISFSLPEIVVNWDEIGTTYRENALIKAKAVAAVVEGPVLADDSGMEIESLQGRPGVYTSSYGGEKSSQAEKTQHLLNELKSFPHTEQRRAKYICCLCYLASRNSEPQFFFGEVTGVILDQRIGTDGFGFDPVFYLPDLGKTFAELSLSEKNILSHRGKAFAKFLAAQPWIIRN